MLKIDRNFFRQLRVQFVRLCTLSDLGITARLAIAFTSVTILAATANFIVEKGASIVEHVLYTKPPAAREPQASVAPRAARQQDQSRAAASQLVVAWGNFDAAVREHLESNSKESGTLYAATRAELRMRGSTYQEQLSQLSPDQRRALQGALQVHDKSAAALIQVAQTQRDLLASCSAIFAAMSTRLQRSIDGAWKIMGRVVARQSVLKLSAQLDDIQSSFASRHAPEAGGGGPAAVARAEQAFAATLQENEAALRRSQSAQWLADMRSDFNLLMTSRASLAQAERRRALLAQAFSRESEQSGETLTRAMNSDAHERARVRAQLPPVAGAPTVIHEAARSPAAAPPTPRSTLVAWVSGIVLAVLGYICVITIVSVVRPVRRLLDATERLGRGEAAPSVTRGGIRELDTLSQSFNVMAGQLAVAQAANRQTLQSLETRVQERTRELQELAERDPLTGLANRRQLFVALGASIGRAARDGRRVGAFFLDIDNFKTLNDGMGHEYGDRVLTAIARRLESTSLPFGFAARLGGDEFTIVHEDAQTLEEIEAAGSSIVDAFRVPIKVDGRELIVSVSVGASIYPDHEQNVEALLRAADAALFEAKAQGRSQLKVFTPELLLRASAKFAIEQNLRRAIEKGEFELFYQPEVSVQTLEASVVEALIRWRMPDGSYRSPGEFLGVAEESGLIVEICDWVLRAAVKTAAEWHHGPWPAVRVAVNVSPRQFLDYRFVENLQHLLDEFRLPARCLELELTESVLQTGPTTIHALGRLREMGVAIALDDFGTGYSSMASLEQLPLTRIKLDRSLIARMDSNSRSASIARGTIGLCSELGLEITAEGVERLEQFSALLGYRAMSLQGYLLSRPVPSDSVLPLLKRMSAHCQELVLLSRSLPANDPEQPAEEGDIMIVDQARVSGRLV
jgi:diguanylate cyclase (GGDEF)-like protein